ncbi:hypothetical protein CO660_16895 [Rhizobium sp. L9]|uniref:hypothetical protein n=1 Tax=Rhizobium sp. L9 TaxID=1340738 RepID=UPI000BE91691|nr:hypothetical protein [Rhizobium sp. L9]PDT28457.1 hypothetical protein CO660_16895 [Rhizobium sp. L9]
MAETRGWDDFAEVADVVGAIAAAFAKLLPQYPALQYVGPMIIDGVGQLTGAATPDDPTQGLPEQLRDSALKFLGGVTGAALAPALAEIIGASIVAAGGATVITPVMAAKSPK